MKVHAAGYLSTRATKDITVYAVVETEHPAVSVAISPRPERSVIRRSWRVRVLVIVILLMVRVVVLV